MSYRNPQIIVDRSAEIYAQATSNLGSQMVSAFENLVEKRRVQAEAIRKRNEGFQLIENDIRLKEYEDLNKISEKIKGTSIEDQFKEMYTDILEGSENNVGAIKAKSILSTTGSTLTKDQRKQLLDVIDKANNFKTLMLEAAGSIIPDIQEYKENVGSGNIGSKYIWKGGSNAERYSNMLAMNALSDGQISGVTYTKKLERLSDGTTEIVVTNTIDTNSDMFKELIKKGTINKEDLKIDENGVATVVWRRDVKKYGDGVITKIPENIDKVKSLQTAGLIDKNGNPSDILLNERNKISVRRSSGTKQIVEEEHFDKTAILNNKTLNDEYKAFASSIITRPIDEQIGYIENTLGIGGFSYKSWQNLEPEKKIDLIKNRLIDNSIEQVAGNSFKSRSATKEDVIQYANQGKIINEGDVIYTRTVKSALSYDTPTQLPKIDKTIIEKQQVKEEANSVYDEYRKDPVGTYEVLTGVAPIYDEKKNTITINLPTEKDGVSEKIIYNMNIPSQRNRFYKKLLDYTDNAKGTSEYARNFRSAFEQALKKGTQKKLSKSKKEEGVVNGVDLLANQFE